MYSVIIVIVAAMFIYVGDKEFTLPFRQPEFLEEEDLFTLEKQNDSLKVTFFPSGQQQGLCNE